jgi:molybdate transport repressor ModE-like protein
LVSFFEMDLRQLTTLVAIADHGSFSAAARALYTVQSNVSGHIARLEKELGVVLVDRQRGGLTDEGMIVVERARRVLHELEDIAADMASRGDEVTGEARFGSIGTTARWLLPRLLPEIERVHPGVHVTVHEGNTTNLVPRVTSGHLDAAVVHLPIDDADVTVHPLFAEDLILLAHTKHPLAEHDSIRLPALAHVPLLLPPTGTALRRIIDRAAGSVDCVLTPRPRSTGCGCSPRSRSRATERRSCRPPRSPAG